MKSGAMGHGPSRGSTPADEALEHVGASKLSEKTDNCSVRSQSPAPTFQKAVEGSSDHFNQVFGKGPSSRRGTNLKLMGGAAL